MEIKNRWLRSVMYHALAPVLAVVLVGCAGIKEERMGRTYLKTGDYDQAVVAAQEAHAKDPQNPAYINLLADATTAAAEHRYELAVKLLAEHRPTEAKKHLDKAVEYMPAYPEANKLKPTVEREVVNLHNAIYLARAAMAEQKWDEARASARRACDIDRDDTDARDLLARIESAAGSAASAPALVTDAASSPAPVAAVPDAGEPALIQITPPPSAARQEGSANAPRRSGELAGATFFTPSHPPQTDAARPLFTTSRPADAAAGFAASPATRPAGPSAIPGQITAARPWAPAATTATLIPSQSGVGAISTLSARPPERLFRGTISRDDQRYKKEVETVDGIRVKIKDADEDPLDADLEIRVPKAKTLHVNDVPRGGGVRIRGESGRAYRLTVVYIDYYRETVGFAIDSLDPSQDNAR